MNTATLLSIQVGMPKERGADARSRQPWTSGIFKTPVAGSVRLNLLNLEGDGQADLQNHGGPYRAVLCYSAEHYPIWRDELKMPDLPYGAFGENFTIAGLDEESVCIGDIYALGEVKIQVTQPRQPCWKLARRWGMRDLTARVFNHGWGGWYCRVLQEGMVEAGLPVTLLERPYPNHSVLDVYALMNEWVEDANALESLAQCEPLSPGWRREFAQRASF